MKLVWTAWRIGVPLLVLGVPLSTYWGLFLIAELASGYWLAFNFQVRREVFFLMHRLLVAMY